MKTKDKKITAKRKKDFRYHGVIAKNNKGKTKKLYHPTYVFLEKGNVYIYVSLTHSKKVENYILIKLKRNPNPKDKKDSYIISEVKEDTKDRFRRKEKGWKIDSEDDELIRKLYKK